MGADETAPSNSTALRQYRAPILHSLPCVVYQMPSSRPFRGMPSAVVRRPVMDNRRPLRTRERTVAVVPFANMSSEATVDAFSDRISDAIVTALRDYAGVAGTLVPQPMLRAPDRHISHLRDSARGDVVLLGNVRQIEGETAVAVSGSLFDAITGRHLWSGSTVAAQYADRSDVTAAARNIAAAIAGALGLSLAPDDVYTIDRDGPAVERARTMWLESNARSAAR